MGAETFAKERKCARFCRCKRTILVGTTKIVAGYSHMCENVNLLGFAAGQNVDGCFWLMRCNTYN